MHLIIYELFIAVKVMSPKQMLARMQKTIRTNFA